MDRETSAEIMWKEIVFQFLFPHPFSISVRAIPLPAAFSLLPVSIYSAISAQEFKDGGGVVGVRTQLDLASCWPTD